MEPHADKTDWLHEHGPRLMLLARQWARSYADAEDVFQEAFARFWQRRNQVRDPIAYVYQCVRRVAIDSKRASQKMGELDANDPPMFVAPHDDVEQKEESILLEEALSRLGDEQREILVMKTWGDLTFAQIGEVLGIPRRTAQSRHRAALNELRLMMKQINVT